MGYDLLVQGGEVVDVAAGRLDRRDVAVAAGRIAAVAPDLDPGGAGRVLDATGLLVTPGLVDLHTHVWRGGGYWGVDPDPVAWRSGVTTWVDAGSAGAYALEGLRAYAASRRVRVKALLNVSVLGLVGESYESRVLDNCNVEDGAAVAELHRGFVVGVKARIDADTVGANGLEPLRHALDLAARAELPLMVHVGGPPPTVPEVLDLLRPGDVLTHCASGAAAGMVEGGEVAAAAREARERGVVFDLGHGAGSFSFEVAEVLLDAGCGPDVISSDLHVHSVRGAARDLPTVITKLLALGMPLPSAVAAATVRPAAVLDLGEGTGTLDPGAPADLALFRVEEGDFTVADVHGGTRRARQRLVNQATILGGEPLPPLDTEPAPPWARP